MVLFHAYDDDDNNYNYRDNHTGHCTSDSPALRVVVIAVVVIVVVRVVAVVLCRHQEVTDVITNTE